MVVSRKENNVYPTTSVPWEVGDGGERSDEVEERPRDDDAIVNVEEEDNHHRRDPNAWKHEYRREIIEIIVVYFDSLAQQTSRVNEALHSCYTYAHVCIVTLLVYEYKVLFECLPSKKGAIQERKKHRKINETFSEEI